MKMDSDDVRFTAYVLGELDEKERAAVEAELESSEAARQTVDEIRRTTALIKDELAAQDSPGLLPAQRKLIETALRRDSAVRFPWRKLYLAASLAAAACLMAAVLVVLRSEDTGRPATPQVAQVLESKADKKETAQLAGRSAPERANSNAQEATAPAGASPEKARSDEPAALEAALASKSVAPQPQLDSRDKAALSRTLADRSPAAADKLAAAQPEPRSHEEAKADQVASLPKVLFGTVSDQSRAPIPGASVKVSDLKSGTTLQAATDDAGRFTFSGLAAGAHKLQVEMPGFVTHSQNVMLSQGKKAEVHATLQVGELAETMTIIAAAPPIQTESASVGKSRQAARRVGAGGIPGSAARGERAKRELDLRRADRAVGSDFNTESYDHIVDNPFVAVSQHPLSTFPIDVDTTSYANVRRSINNRQLPPKDSVRIEEMVNYFSYDYRPPQGQDRPFAAHVEVAAAPWNREHRLVRIGLKGREQIGITPVAIAKDVTVQVEFSAALTKAWRLIGYGKGLVRHQDFNDDKKDAAEIGAAHTVTALYEVVPVRPGQLLTIKLRYKEPDEEKSKLMEIPVVDGGARFEEASEDFRFAAAVASFGMLLRDSPYKGASNFDSVMQMALDSVGADRSGYRAEFVELVKRARALREFEK